MPQPSLRRVSKPDLGFAAVVPEHWTESPPASTTGGFEVARFGHRDEDTRNCLVFRLPFNRSLRRTVAGAQGALEPDGFQHFNSSDVEIAGRPAIRLDFDKVLSFGLWTVRHYFVASGGSVYVLSIGTTNPASDAALIDEMASRFELFERPSVAA